LPSQAETVLELPFPPVAVIMAELLQWTLAFLAPLHRRFYRDRRGF
jgi:hypothetical protein